MRRRSLSLRWRLTLWYIALLAGALLAFSLMVYLLLHQQLIEAEDDALESLGLLVDRALLVADGRLTLADATQASGRDDRFVRVYDAQGRLVIDTSASVAGAPPPEAAPPPYEHARFRTVAGAPYSFRMLAQPIRRGEATVGELQVVQLLDEQARTEQRLLIVLGAAIPLALLLVSWGGVFLARRALAPIDQLTRAAQRISAQDLSRRLAMPARDDELGRLAATFDGMIARLEQAFLRERQLTADASHELRTPLTAMRGQIEVALTRPRSAAEYQATLRSVLGQAEQLSRLVADLLRLARSDAGALPLEPEPFDLAQLAGDVVEQLRPLAERRAIRLVLDAPAALPIVADQDRLLQVLINLLDNGLRHTPGDGVVRLACRADGEHALIEVRDSGPGIAAEHLPHIFERFYRVDGPRARAHGGAGLGLAIVRSIVAAHGGSIVATSPSGGGSCFTVRLPLRHFAGAAPERPPAP